jgi:phenylacetate-CoA ligase
LWQALITSHRLGLFPALFLFALVLVEQFLAQADRLWRHLDQLIVEVEKAASYQGADADLQHHFARQLKSVTGVTAAVNILAPDSLPRATHKAKRVDDRRTGVWNA